MSHECRKCISWPAGTRDGCPEARKGSLNSAEQAGAKKIQACEAGRHKYDPHTLACRCGVRLDEPGQGLMFGYDPLAEGETRRREAVSGQWEMFHGDVRTKE